MNLKLCGEFHYFRTIELTVDVIYALNLVQTTHFGTTSKEVTPHIIQIYTCDNMVFCERL